MARKAPRPQDLLRRWPDLPLIETFQSFFAVYQELGARETAHDAYRLLCGWLKDALAGHVEAVPDRARRPEEQRARSIALALRERHPSDWLQRMASLLAMLMHFDVGPEGVLVNRRRPGRPFSTYPTSPAVARLVAETLISSLLRRDIPARCSAAEAERYAERVLDFRILDPSMESGQLLLEIAQAVLRRIERRHPPGTLPHRRLSGALLEKLWRDCLWGIDRSALAPRAVEVLVSLLGAGHGLAHLRPARLLAGDAFDIFDRGKLPRFDGIVNNPPWGEDVDPGERKRLRRSFQSMQHRTDTYVPFSELAIRCLRPEGVFAMILPSQALTARNSAGLRELLVEQTILDRIVLLPRAAFGDATVRGLVLVGRVGPASLRGACRATVYPLVKRMATTGPPQSFKIRHKELKRFAGAAWSPLLTGRGPGEESVAMVALDRLAIVAPGVQLYGAGRGTLRQTAEVVRLRPYSLPGPGAGATPAIRGRDVQPFRVLDPSEYVSFGAWLARVGGHDGYRRTSRIFVRELIRRDGRLSAAVARDGFIPLHGVLTVVPTRVDPRVLVAILNSAKAAEYVQAHASSFSKVDFQRITVGELRRMPVPASIVDPPSREDLELSPRSKRESVLLADLVALVDELASDQTPGEKRAADLRDRLETVVSALFG